LDTEVEVRPVWVVRHCPNSVDKAMLDTVPNTRLTDLPDDEELRALISRARTENEKSYQY
jgi:hypothetical protein